MKQSQPHALAVCALLTVLVWWCCVGCGTSTSGGGGGGNAVMLGPRPVGGPLPADDTAADPEVVPGEGASGVGVENSGTGAGAPIEGDTAPPAGDAPVPDAEPPGEEPDVTTNGSNEPEPAEPPLSEGCLAVEGRTFRSLTQALSFSGGTFTWELEDGAVRGRLTCTGLTLAGETEDGAVVGGRYDALVDAVIWEGVIYVPAGTL